MQLEDKLGDIFRKCGISVVGNGFLSLEEIYSGTYNYVYRIVTKEGDFILKKFGDETKSEIFKSLRMNADDRANMEYNAGRIFGNILGDNIVPRIYYFDFIEHSDNIFTSFIGISNRQFPEKCNLIKEIVYNERIILLDCFGGNLWRDELLENKFEQDVVRDVGRIMGKMHFETFGRYCDRVEFLNLTVLEEELRTHYYDIAGFYDVETAKNIRKLAEMHRNDKSTLIHGDLTSRSVFVKARDVRVIDFELAHLGMSEYDVGHFIAECFLYTQYNSSVIDKIKESVKDFIKEYFSVFDCKNRDESERMMTGHTGVICLYRTDGIGKSCFVKDERARERVREGARKMINEDVGLVDSLEFFV